MENLNVGSLPLSDHDADWIKAMATVSNSSLRVKLASIVGYYVRRRKEEYLEIIDYTAQKYDLSFDECFKRLSNNEDLGEPKKDFTYNHRIEELLSSIESKEGKSD